MKYYSVHKYIFLITFNEVIEVFKAEPKYLCLILLYIALPINCLYAFSDFLNCLSVTTLLILFFFILQLAAVAAIKTLRIRNKISEENYSLSFVYLKGILLYINPLILNCLSNLNTDKAILHFLFNIFLFINCFVFSQWNYYKTIYYLSAIKCIYLFLFYNQLTIGFFIREILLALLVYFLNKGIGFINRSYKEEEIQTIPLVSKDCISQTEEKQYESVEVQATAINNDAETITEGTGPDKAIFESFFKSLPQPAMLIDLNVNVQAALPKILNPKAEEILNTYNNFFQEAKLESGNSSLADLFNTTRRKVTNHSIQKDSLKFNIKESSNSSEIAKEKYYDITAATFEYNGDTRIMAIMMMESPKDRERENQIIESFKTSLVCTLSHELCTPLNGLIPIIKQIPSSHTDDDQKEDLKEIALANLELLQCKIKDLIDFTKIEMHEFKPDDDQFSVEELFEDLSKIFKLDVRAKQNELNFKINTSANRKLLILTDKLRIKQVLVKLITNANKYTSKGYINVSASDSQDNLDVTFSVSDTGSGIPRDRMTFIFATLQEKARLVNAPYERSTKLPGLGLIIAKSICECLDSKLDAKSTEKFGSTFYFKLPTCRIYTTPQYPRKDIEKILPTVAETYRPVAKVPQSKGSVKNVPQFDKKSLDLIPKKDNKLLLEKCASTCLPDVPALPLIPELEEQKDIKDKTVLNDSKDQPNRERDYSFSEIAEEKKENKGKRSESSSPKTANCPGEKTKTKVVLIVDDVHTNRIVLRGLLKNKNINTIEAQDGLEAVNTVAESFKENSLKDIKLILMDLDMPIKDGIEATKDIRKLEKEHNRTRIPIVAVTAHNDETDKTASLSAGMQKFIPKPVDAKTMGQIISELMKI